MIRLLRHDASVPREDDGAVRFDDLVKEFEAKFDGSSQRSANDWITYLVKGGGQKKRFHYYLNPHSSKLFLYFRAFLGHPGKSLVDPALHDNLLSTEDFNEYIYHVGNVSEKHSIIRSGFRSVEEIRCDLDKPRIAPHKNTWRPHQNTVYWCDLKLAQKKGFQFYPTPS